MHGPILFLWVTAIPGIGVYVDWGSAGSGSQNAPRSEMAPGSQTVPCFYASFWGGSGWIKVQCWCNMVQYYMLQGWVTTCDPTNARISMISANPGCNAPTLHFHSVLTTIYHLAFCVQHQTCLSVTWLKGVQQTIILCIYFTWPSCNPCQQNISLIELWSRFNQPSQ